MRGKFCLRCEDSITGLLVWHILPNRAWDLESAWGKNPVTGRDTLEADWCFEGFAGDFFTNSPPLGLPARMNFSRVTNPNTNLYSQLLYTSAQSVPTTVAIENIRRDPNPSSTDMLVDVYLQPIQFVTFPNGGEFHVSGNNLVATWRWRDPAISGISTVDVGLSFDGGLSYPILNTGRPNTGSFDFGPIGGTHSQVTLCVTSYDPIANATDVSDATFTIWDIIESSISPVITNFCLDTSAFFGVNVSWQTSVPTDALVDKLEVYSLSGTLLGSKTGGTGGTSHQLNLKVACGTGTYYFIVKSKKGTGETISGDHLFEVTSCPSCPTCGPPPDCEIE